MVGRTILSPPSFGGLRSSFRRVKDNTPYLFRRPLLENPLTSASLDPALPDAQQPVALLGVTPLMRCEDHGNAAFLHKVTQ
jgi:hypothetical protein